MSTAAIHDGLVYIPDLAGFVHCLDFESGKRYWEFDTLAEIWGSAMVVGDRVLVGDEYGDLRMFAVGTQANLLSTVKFDSSILSTPSTASGVLFVATRSRLYAIGR